MSYKTIWSYYCIAAAVAIALYFIGKVLGIDSASEMWTTVWGLIVCANMYAIKIKDENKK